MQKLTKIIKDGKIFVSDGAWGTLLQEKGLKPGECPELWNIDHRNDILDIAKSYVDSGSDMIETNSFGANSFKLKNYNLAGKVEELNVAAVEISKEAVGKDKFVLGLIGPTGKMLMIGDVTEEQLYNEFRKQANAIEKAKADAIIIETMTDLEEARIAVKAVKENTSLEVICSMSFEKSLTGEFHTMMGITPLAMTKTLKDAGVDIIGANCGRGIEEIIEITMEIRSVDSQIPIIAQPNAGIPEYKDGKIIYPDSPEKMAGLIPELINAGANIIGGCCGTTPDHIMAIAKTVKYYDSTRK